MARQTIGGLVLCCLAVFFYLTQGFDMAKEVSPVDDLYNDCPVITKTRVVSVSKGVCDTLVWEMRDRTGSIIDVSSYLDLGNPPVGTNGQVLFRFNDVTGSTTLIHQIVGYSIDAAAAAKGLVKGELTSKLVEKPGIYTFEVGITDKNNSSALVQVDSGMLSVERGFFGDAGTVTGPPTISELRLQLRDTAIENDLWDDVEFDDAEILWSLAKPIREWNETSPNIGTFSSQTFPFHHFWTVAATANLLKIAASWYQRNHLPASHGGITVDDKNKSNPYLQIAMQLQGEWKEFMMRKKVELNAAQVYGTINSPY
jgi:hypothetical protein|tara:strand:- start:2038 stop:2976 length:939 start_codon:yes stop_codon:yes gene_type:complete